MRCLGASPTPGEVQRHLHLHRIGEPRAQPPKTRIKGGEMRFFWSEDALQEGTSTQSSWDVLNPAHGLKQCH